MASVDVVPSCFEVIGEVDAAMRQALPETPYYVLGGLASSAVIDQGSHFDHESRVLVAGPNSDLPTIRRSGSTRDIDILAHKTLTEAEASDAKSVLGEATDGRLKVSLFDLDLYEEFLTEKARRNASLLPFSKRTIDDNGIVRYEIFPMQQEVSEEAFEPAWTLMTPKEDEIRILPPPHHVMAYGLRAVWGDKTKDRDKLERMRLRIGGYPQFVEELNDGPYRPLLELDRAASKLRLGALPKDSPLLRPDATAKEMRFFGIKSRALAAIEKVGLLNHIMQSDRVQTALKPLIGEK